jgi:hypothetical protein
LSEHRHCTQNGPNRGVSEIAWLVRRDEPV